MKHTFKLGLDTMEMIFIYFFFNSEFSHANIEFMD